MLRGLDQKRKAYLSFELWARVIRRVVLSLRVFLLLPVL